MDPTGDGSEKERHASEQAGLWIGWAVVAAVVLFWLLTCARDGPGEPVHAPEPKEPEATEAVISGEGFSSPAVELIGGSYEFARAPSASALEQLNGENVLKVDMATGKVTGEPSSATAILINSASGLQLKTGPGIILEPTLARHFRSIIVDRQNRTDVPIRITIVSNLGPGGAVPTRLMLDPTSEEWKSYKIRHGAWERGEDVPKAEPSVEYDHPVEIRIP